MDDGMTVAPQLRIFRFKTLNQLEYVSGRVVLEDLAEKIVETLCTGRCF
jgi:hypothetical protein